jgi:excisionase family DNA binding protein
MDDRLLRTRQVAEALGVSPSTVKRWVDLGILRASRTVGKHRLIASSETLRFAKQRGMLHAGLEGVEAAAGPAGSIDGLREALERALCEGRAIEATALIRSFYESGQGATALGDLLIGPVMEQVGHGWMIGRIDVYQEHLATQIVAASLHDLIARAPRPSDKPRVPLALGAAAEGDMSSLPVLLGELVLRELGWRVHNLGPHLPLRSLANAVGDQRPGLVFLTVNHMTDIPQFLREYRSFYEVAAANRAAVILGGRAIGPDLRAELVFASFGDRMAHLSEFAKRLLGAADAASSPGRAQP